MQHLFQGCVHIAELQANVETLEGQTDQQKQVLAALQGRAKNSEINSANTKAQLTEANAELSRLQTQIADANKALNAARIELASARSAKDEEDAALVVQQFKLTEPKPSFGKSLNPLAKTKSRTVLFKRAWRA